MLPAVSYVNYIPYEDTNKDVVAILSEFVGQTNKYAAIDSVMGVVRTTNKLLEGRDSKGGAVVTNANRPIMDKVADKLGIASLLKQQNVTNEAALIKDVIMQQILNRGNVPLEISAGNYNISLSKIADNLMGFQSMTQIGGGVLSIFNPILGNPPDRKSVV